eukprot:gene16155-22315_t
MGSCLDKLSVHLIQGNTIVWILISCSQKKSSAPASLRFHKMNVMQMRCFGGAKALAPSIRCAAPRPFTSRVTVVTVKAEGDRMRLNNLTPEKGSRRTKTRKGRGWGAGQGGTCGFGNRGQKARSGTGTRSGFEGGQTPLYRRLPKLRGIAGGMSAGVPSYVCLNLKDLEKYFSAEEEVTVEIVKAKFSISGKEAKLPLKVHRGLDEEEVSAEFVKAKFSISVKEAKLPLKVHRGLAEEEVSAEFVKAKFSISVKEAKLPLKILGTGTLSKSLKVKAAAFSASAKTAIEAVGGTAEVAGVKQKWTRGRYNWLKKSLIAEGKTYEEVMKTKKGRVNKLRLAKKGKPTKVKATKA